ncbi:hypothetical protein GIX83_02355 [Lactobacillus reuteri]|uniref:Uncharacterized protein n=1 Tax=Limosilactobacillus reuteri TaxID=1598 RepID=A0A6A8D8Q2_LIMRT|nr:hypothetical protein [Limosilactobacillus reuteri]MRG68665.1 hypothetical protein [Limosilactobacillus reuteri]MRG68715.1 hypothetical protein [Limosilactobacillus reuteri]
MKVTWGEWSADVYPVEPFVYEVVADGKKEFYQAAWDAFCSDLHMNNINAKIIRIPVIPISDDEIKAESIAFELGEKRDYPNAIKEFEDVKAKEDSNIKSKPNIKFSEIMSILAIVVWLICMTILVIASIISNRG